MQPFESLFSKPLPSSRTGAFYNTFPYPTKISPEAIAIYIACATNPGDTVLDSFAGSGSTGIAAILCEHPTKQMMSLAEQMGVTPTWGKRNAVLYEIGTYASFAMRTLLSGIEAAEFAQAVDSFISKAEKLIGQVYAVRDINGKNGYTRYVIWTEVLTCPQCHREVSYFDYGTSRNPVKFNDTITCPHCGTTHAVADMSFATEKYYDRILKKELLRKKRIPAWIYGTTEGKNWDRKATKEDYDSFKLLEEEIDISSDPQIINWGELHRAGYHFGIDYLHQFYTSRNYAVMLKLWHLAETYPERTENALKLLLLSYNSTHCTLMTRVVAKKNSRDFVLTGAQSGVLYISKLPVEKNILLGLKRKAKPFIDAYTILENCTGKVRVHNLSSTHMVEENNSIDFVFTDPPFGDFIPYAEVNQINELWLQEQTNRTDEVIISDSQNKSLSAYQAMMTAVFTEINRVLKPDHYAAVVFHAAKAKVWEAFRGAVISSGLSFISSSILDKKQASFKQIVSDTSVQGDPMFLLQERALPQKNMISGKQILDTIIREHMLDGEFDERRCYSLYISKCIEDGIEKTMDAKNVYNYFQKQKEAASNEQKG